MSALPQAPAAPPAAAPVPPPAAGGFGAGARALFRGASLIAGNPKLWPYALAPIVIASFALALGFAGGVWAVGALAERWFQHWTGPLWGSLRVGAQALGYLSAILGAVIVSKALILPIVAGPFMEMLSERIEALVTGAAPSSRTFREELGDALPAAWRGVSTLLYRLGILLLFAPLLLIPGIGVILYLVPSAYVEALNGLDVTFGRKRMDLAAKRAWLRARRGSAIGFGAAILLGNFVPIVGALAVVPAAAAGGTLLFVGERKP